MEVQANLSLFAGPTIVNHLPNDEIKFSFSTLNLLQTWPPKAVLKNSDSIFSKDELVSE